LEVQQHFWGSEIKEALPTIAYEDIMASDEGVGRWLTQIHTYGFSLVDGTPIDPDKTQSLLERIAFIRQTHYGGFYDFTADLAHGDLAYTNIALPPHNDTTYFSDPAGLQMFHLLEFDGTGGESLLVDGFKAAKQLRQDHSKAYSTLSRVRVPTHSAGDIDKCITPSIGGGAFPILNHDPATGLLSQVRYNNEDRSTMTTFTDDRELEEFYEALQIWHALLVSKEMMLQFPMKPGQALIFDNWRVLHGRTAFDATKRRICGGYVNMDDYQSRRRLTTRGRDAVMFDL
jgi:trimethyllysine dioxygenase